MNLRDLKRKIDHYFKTVSKEQLDADLKAANFEFYNKVGINFIPPPGYNKRKKKNEAHRNRRFP